MKNKKAFSLSELLFVIAIISLLAVLLFPVFERAREQGRSAVCFSNMRQVGVSVLLYLQDYDETYPMNRMPDETPPLEGCKLIGTSEFPIGSLEDSKVNWRRLIQPYLKSKQAMVCPLESLRADFALPEDPRRRSDEPVLHPQRLPPTLLRL